MPGRIENTRRAKPIPCDCRRCYHAKTSAGVLFCRHYDRINPQKSFCARYQPMPGKCLGQKRRGKSKNSK